MQKYFHRFIIILFSLGSFFAKSQCTDSIDIKLGGDFNFVPYIHNCPTYSFAFDGDPSKEWNFLGNPISINQAPKEVLKFKRKIESKILEYAGKNFSEKLKFYNVDVVYLEHAKKFNKNGRRETFSTSCKAKYFYYYNFKPFHNITYLVGIAVDRKGKIISEFNFPSHKDYKEFDSDFSICKIIDIAKKQPISITPIDSISLEYDKTNKIFYWNILQKFEVKNVGYNKYNSVIINASDLTQIKTVERHAFIQF